MTDLNKPSLAERRSALIEECSQQRTYLAREISHVNAPKLTGGGIIESLAAGRMKLPLTIAGLLIGIVASKRGAAMPMLATGMSLFRLGQSVLAMVRTRAG
jgi:hypothetical protein